jgi:hypothetical protein
MPARHTAAPPVQSLVDGGLSQGGLMRPKNVVITQTDDARSSNRSILASYSEQQELEHGLERAADDGWPTRKRSDHLDARSDNAASRWEYLICALPRFAAPTQSPQSSVAIRALNDLGEDGWEAVDMTVLADGSVAVLLKRPGRRFGD